MMFAPMPVSLLKIYFSLQSNIYFPHATMAMIKWRFDMLFIFLILIAIVLLRFFTLLAAYGLLILALCAIACWIVKIPPGDNNDKFHRYCIAVSLVLLSFGIIAIILTKDRYVGLLSGNITYGGPHPMAILIAILGGLLLLTTLILHHLLQYH